MGQSASVSDRQSSKAVSKATDGFIRAEVGHFEHSQWLQISDVLLLSLECRYLGVTYGKCHNGLEGRKGAW